MISKCWLGVNHIAGYITFSNLNISNNNEYTQRAISHQRQELAHQLAKESSQYSKNIIMYDLRMKCIGITGLNMSMN